jgi:hypothetical protein
MAPGGFFRLEMNSEKILFGRRVVIPVLPSMTKLSPLHSLSPTKDCLRCDYYGLQFESLLLQPDHLFRRSIRRKDGYGYHKEHRHWLEELDRESSKASHRDSYEDLDHRKPCRQPKWTYDTYPFCNVFHEMSYGRPVEAVEQEYDVEYLDHGYYRDSFLFTSKTEGTNEKRQCQ